MVNLNLKSNFDFICKKAFHGDNITLDLIEVVINKTHSKQEWTPIKIVNSEFLYYTGNVVEMAKINIMYNFMVNVNDVFEIVGGFNFDFHNGGVSDINTYSQSYTLESLRKVFRGDEFTYNHTRNFKNTYGSDFDVFELYTRPEISKSDFDDLEDRIGMIYNDLIPKMLEIAKLTHTSLIDQLS